DPRRHALRALQVPRDGALAARQLVHRPRADPVDAHDVGAEVGENHPAERRGREPGHLDDADSLESAHETSALTETSARTQAAGRTPIACRSKAILDHASSAL